MSSGKLFLLMVLMVGIVAARSTWRSEEAADTEDGGQGEEELETNNKFAHLFRQMLAKQRETNMDCALSEDCPTSLECVAAKCRSMGPRRTKMINLYSRW
ncbi:hypothetical protein L5515_005154 [Caenorhabditis briggsae]|uniref:Uncharacterized protein n=3 Tax=Caenorhabditis briggsae TaxID=6238 RepID=A0AAE9EME6_CAEBR|nr:hypothetical protein L5515_005154 [Caenorhabditis briggsae]